MSKHETSFFWGVLAGAAAAAIAGGIILARSFRSCGAGIDSWEDLPETKAKATPRRAKAGKKRRGAAKK